MSDATAEAIGASAVPALPVPVVQPDPMAGFAAMMSALPLRHHRRLGLALAQLGMLITVAFLPISIAGMNVGLTTALVGALVACPPWQRCVGAGCYLVYLVWLALWAGSVGWSPTALGAPVLLPLGLLLGQVTFNPGLPGAPLLRRWTLRLLVIALCASCLLALAQFVIGKGSAKPLRVDPAGMRFYQSTGFFAIQLTQGVVAGMGCMLVGGLAIGMTPAWRLVGQLAGAVAVAICGARAALLAFVAGVTGVIAVRGRRHLVLAATIALLLLAGGLGLIAKTQPQRFADLLAMRDGRWAIWRTSLDVIAAHPLFGAGGPPGYREAYREAYPRVVPDVPSEFPDGAPHAHNTALAFAAEYGIPMSLIWFVMLVVAVCGLRRGPPEVWRAGLGMGIVVVVFGQFEKLDGESSRALWAGLGILLALRSGIAVDASSTPVAEPTGMVPHAVPPTGG